MWQRRIRRAEFLEAKWMFASEVLRFFRVVTAFQRDVHSRFPSSVIANLESGNLKSSARVLGDALTPFLPPLLDLVSREGPPVLAERAATMWEWGDEKWKRELEAEASRSGDRSYPVAFFARVLLQAALFSDAGRGGGGGSGHGTLDAGSGDGPAFRLHSPASGPASTPTPSFPAAASPSRYCPACAHPPVVSILREDIEAQSVARTLVCSLCGGDWAYPRVLCPACGEERPEKMPRYAAEEIPWMRVEGCDACGRYLKAVDLTRAAAAEPVTDEVGSTPLDVIARERGYEKIAANILGI